MKKILLVLFFLVVLIGASIWYVLSRYGISDSAAIVPGDVVAFVSLPDVVQTSLRWQQTALAKISNEPSIAEFMEKPLELLGSQGMDEAIGILARLKPGRIFASVNSVSEDNVSGVIGFQYFGSKKDFEEAITRLHREIEKLVPGTTRSELTHSGDTITQLTKDGHSLFTGSHGSWGFLSNNLDTMQNAIDRAAGRDSSPSLADSETFQSCRQHVDATAEFLWFVQTAPLIDVLAKVGESMDAAADPSQWEQLRKIEAAAGTLAFSGADQVEKIYFVWKDSPKLPDVAKETLAFTSPQDIVFGAGVQDWTALESSDYLASQPKEVRDALASFGIQLDQLPNWFGDNSVIVANWPSGAMFPTMMAAIAVRDRPAIEALTRNLVEKFSPAATISQRQGATVFEFPIPGFSLVDPAIAVSDDYAIAALTSSALTTALTRSANRETLEASPAFQSIADRWNQPCQSFLFIDTKTIFERIFDTARPLILFGAAMSPDVAKVVDIQKLPETDTIAKHLTPITMTQKQVDDGWLLESRGPVTLNQLIVVVAGGAGIGAASGILQNNP